MAEANTTKEQLYLEENVKTIKELPHDLIRLCCSYQELNNKFEEKFKFTQNSYQLFQSQSMYVEKTKKIILSHLMLNKC